MHEKAKCYEYCSDIIIVQDESDKMRKSKMPILKGDAHIIISTSE